MQRLADKDHYVDVQILDNKVRTYFKRNIAERAIRNFKAHFISVLIGLYPNFPKFMWDNLLVQTELTANLLQKATINPSMSVWEYFNGAFDYTATPLEPIGCKIVIHNTSNKRKS